MKARDTVMLWLFALAGETLGAPAGPANMVLVPAGIYHPLFESRTAPAGIKVSSFYLDALPVTVGDYLEFVLANPQWQRSRVKRIFADEAYLQNWEGDLKPGTTDLADALITQVSWFAARAYAQWKGKRLPTIAEWERAAAASPTRPDGENDPAFRRQILEWYATPSFPLVSVEQGKPNFWGIRDLHGMVWEWVLDFNAALLGDDTQAGGQNSRGLFCGGASQGARDVDDYPAFMRTGFRSSLKADYCVHNLGFRCAKDL